MLSTCPNCRPIYDAKCNGTSYCATVKDVEVFSVGEQWSQMGSGYGAVGRAVASCTKDSQF